MTINYQMKKKQDCWKADKKEGEACIIATLFASVTIIINAKFLQNMLLHVIYTHMYAANCYNNSSMFLLVFSISTKYNICIPLCWNHKGTVRVNVVR